MNILMPLPASTQLILSSALANIFNEISAVCVIIMGDRQRANYNTKRWVGNDCCCYRYLTTATVCMPSVLGVAKWQAACCTGQNAHACWQADSVTGGQTGSSETGRRGAGYTCNTSGFVQQVNNIRGILLTHKRPQWPKAVLQYR